ncbi:MAG: ArsR/SmtB family transcription factor [Planctomycetota bacterium]
MTGSADDVLYDLMFRAFADRTRLRILSVLRDGPTCVGDLVTVVGAPQPTISRHLATLRRAKLVTVERQGTWCIYALAPPASPLHERLLDCLGCCLAGVPQLRRDARTLARLRAKGGCCPSPAGGRRGEPATADRGLTNGPTRTR